MKNVFNSVVCILTAMSIAVFPYHSVFAAAADDRQGTEAIEQRIEELDRKAKRLRGALKRERFDPEARVESADYDLETLVEFVREHIAFQPYAGTLRGATGTLPKNACTYSRATATTCTRTASSRSRMIFTGYPRTTSNASSGKPAT